MRLWKSWVNFVWDCKTFVIPLVLVMAAVPVLSHLGHQEAAGEVGRIGTPLVLLVNFVYIVFYHSRRKWPEAAWYVRFFRLITFRR